MASTHRQSEPFNATLRQVHAAAGDSLTMSLRERIDELFLVCQDAAELERLRLQAGQPPVVQAPWPKSTIEFLRKEARKHHE